MEEMQQEIAALGDNGKFPKLVILADDLANAMKKAYGLGAGEGMTPEQYAALGSALALHRASVDALKALLPTS